MGEAYQNELEYQGSQLYASIVLYCHILTRNNSSKGDPSCLSTPECLNTEPDTACKATNNDGDYVGTVLVLWKQGAYSRKLYVQYDPLIPQENLLETVKPILCFAPGHPATTARQPVRKPPNIY